MYYEMYQTGLQWYWRLRASNHKIIADSAESYWNKADCENGIKLVKGSTYAPIYTR